MAHHDAGNYSAKHPSNKLNDEIAHAIEKKVLDGEITCADAEGFGGANLVQHFVKGLAGLVAGSKFAADHLVIAQPEDVQGEHPCQCSGGSQDSG